MRVWHNQEAQKRGDSRGISIAPGRGCRAAGRPEEGNDSLGITRGCLLATPRVSMQGDSWGIRNAPTRWYGTSGRAGKVNCARHCGAFREWPSRPSPPRSSARPPDPSARHPRGPGRGRGGPRRGPREPERRRAAGQRAVRDAGGYDRAGGSGLFLPESRDGGPQDAVRRGASLSASPLPYRGVPGRYAKRFHIMEISPCALHGCKNKASTNRDWNAV